MEYTPERLRELGLEKTAHYFRMADVNATNALDQRALAAVIEILARIEELTDENADLRLNMTKDGLLVRMQEANQNGYECGRSLAEAERFMLEKERDAEKQRADELEKRCADLEILAEKWCEHTCLADTCDGCPLKGRNV